VGAELPNGGRAEGHDAAHEVRPADGQDTREDTAAALPEDGDALPGGLEELLEPDLQAGQVLLATAHIRADSGTVRAVAVLA
jgi:hypothetical protein